MCKGYEAFSDMKKLRISLQKEQAIEKVTQLLLSYLHLIKVGCGYTRQIKEFSP